MPNSKTLYLYDVNTGKLIQLNKTVVIGRSKGDITFPNDTFMSGSHCKIIVQSDTVSIADLKSKNMTKVNGSEIGALNQVELHINDRIEFGKQHMILTDNPNYNIGKKKYIPLPKTDHNLKFTSTKGIPVKDQSSSIKGAHNDKTDISDVSEDIEIEFDKVAILDPTEKKDFTNTEHRLNSDIQKLSKELEQLESESSELVENWQQEKKEYLLHLEILKKIFLTAKQKPEDMDAFLSAFEKVKGISTTIFADKYNIKSNMMASSKKEILARINEIKAELKLISSKK